MCPLSFMFVRLAELLVSCFRMCFASSIAVTMCSLKGETLTLRRRVKTITVRWKQGSLFGFGGDRSQYYVLCDYTTSLGNSVPVYIQRGYDILQKLTIDSRLQYGTQDNVLFFVYHDKSQTPYQERFRCDGLQTFVYAANEVLKIGKGIDISWMAGNYLVNV